MSRNALIDMTGQHFGEWIVLHHVPSDDSETWWLCRCSCGTERTLRGWMLRKGKSVRCSACSARELARRHEVAPGTRHGEWTVVQEASPVVIGKDPTTRQQRDTQMWTCRCHCGAVVDISRKHLNSVFRPVCRHGQLPTSMNTGNRKDPDPNE